MEKSNKYKAPKLEEMTLDYLRGYQRAITDLELMAELQKEEAHENDRTGKRHYEHMCPYRVAHLLSEAKKYVYHYEMKNRINKALNHLKKIQNVEII